MTVLFSKCIFGNIPVLPELLVRMINRHAHQANQIHRLHGIIVFTLLILSLICPTGVADTPFEPGLLKVLLQLYNKYCSRLVLTHEVITKVLIISDYRSWMFSGHILDVHSLPMIWQQFVDDCHHFVLVVLITEECIESSQTEYVHILLLELFSFLFFHIQVF